MADPPDEHEQEHLTAADAAPREQLALDPNGPTLLDGAPGSDAGSALDATLIEPASQGATPGSDPGLATVLEAGSGAGSALGPSSGLGPASGRLSASGSGLERSLTPEVGKLFADKYELLSEIARGGMGVVYRARQLDLKRIVALKVMLAGAYAAEEERRRFVLEAEASARLKHPHIVPVYDIGEVGGNLYFTMDYVEGAPLSERKRALDRAALLEVMIKVCDGVAYAHQRGIIHRDLKPANIMMTAGDEPLIMDFGLAKQVEVADADGAPSLVTREGAIMGTPHYMPPEQASGEVSEIDVRSDVYTLGVILYELFTGQLPFSGRAVSELLLRIFNDDPQPPRRLDPTIDPDLEAIVLKALEKPKERRYQSAAELRDDLRRLRDGLTVTARRATPLYRARKWARRHRGQLAVGALLGAVVLGAGAYGVQSRRQAELAAEARLRAQVGEAQVVAEALAPRVAALEAEVGALAGSGAVGEARRAEVAALGGRADELAGELELARGPLQAYSDRLEAARAAAALDGLLGRLAPVRQRLADLAKAGERLEEAGASLARAREQAATARRALEAAGALEDAGEELGSLAEAAAAGERWLARSAEAVGAGATSPGPAFEAAWAALEGSLEAVNRDVFAALALAAGGADSPESRAGQALLDGATATRAEIEARRAEVVAVRFAAATLVRARALLDLLEQARGAPAPERLRAARVAQALARRAGVRLADEAVESALHRANRAYLSVLLVMKAYEVFDVEIEDRTALAEADREALLAAKEQALAATRALEEQLERALGEPLEGVGVEALLARAAALEERRADPALTPELAAVLREALSRLRGAARERAAAELARERQRLEQSAAQLGREEQRERLDELLAGWAGLAERYETRAPLLGPAEATLGRRACLRGAAGLRARVAHALRLDDPARALALASQANEALAALLRQGAASPAEAEAAAALVAELTRRSRRPEGMVLIEPRARVELGGGPLDRNEPRVVTLAPYYLSQREVTAAEYGEFVASASFRDEAFWEGVARRVGRPLPAPPAAPPGWEGASPPEGEAELPVRGITWFEAWGYALFRGMRLPSDDEWEYAARYQDEAGGALRFPWGDAWTAEALADELHEPGANERDRTLQGLRDMGGNVSEWVAIAAEGEALGAAARGASFLYPLERIARGTHRLRPRPSYRGPQLGLRLAQDAR